MPQDGNYRRRSFLTAKAVRQEVGENFHLLATAMQAVLMTFCLWCIDAQPADVTATWDHVRVAGRGSSRVRHTRDCTPERSQGRSATARLHAEIVKARLHGLYPA